MSGEGVAGVFPHPEGTDAETHTFTASQMGVINSVKRGATLAAAAVVILLKKKSAAAAPAEADKTPDQK